MLLTKQQMGDIVIFIKHYARVELHAHLFAKIVKLMAGDDSNYFFTASPAG